MQVENPMVRPIAEDGYCADFPVKQTKVDRYGTPIDGERIFVDWNRFEEVHSDNLEKYLHDVYSISIEFFGTKKAHSAK